MKGWELKELMEPVFDGELTVGQEVRMTSKDGEMAILVRVMEIADGKVRIRVLND